MHYLRRLVSTRLGDASARDKAGQSTRRPDRVHREQGTPWKIPVVRPNTFDMAKLKEGPNRVLGTRYLGIDDCMSTEKPKMGRGKRSQARGHLQDELALQTGTKEVQSTLTLS